MDNEKHQIDSLDRNDVRVLGGRNVASRYTTGQCLSGRRRRQPLVVAGDAPGNT